MDKIYCGIADDANIPKGKKRGNMKECAEKGQVAYWGKLKTDSVQIKIAQKKDMEKRFKGKTPSTKKYDTMYDKKISEFASLKGKLSRVEREMRFKQDDKAGLKALEVEKEKIEEQFEKVRGEMRDIKKNIDDIKNSKKKKEINNNEDDEMTEYDKKISEFSSLKGKLSKIERQLENKKLDEDEKKDLENQKEQLDVKFKKVKDEMNELKKKDEPKPKPQENKKNDMDEFKKKYPNVFDDFDFDPKKFDKMEVKPKPKPQPKQAKNLIDINMNQENFENFKKKMIDDLDKIFNNLPKERTDSKPQSKTKALPKKNEDFEKKKKMTTNG